MKSHNERHSDNKMTSFNLPVVDFSSLNIADVKASESPVLRETGKLKPLADELMEALGEMRHLFDVTREFFALPEDVKKKYIRKPNAVFHGYGTREIERPKHVDSVERYETFMACPLYADELWAQEVSEFKPASLDVFYEFQEFSYRVCDVLGVGLGLKDPGYIRRSHVFDYGEFRNTLYHSYPDDFVPQPGQLRFVEHYDSGTVSFIYQDSAGGLEVIAHTHSYRLPYVRILG
ncbi:uncharacterized protein LOC135463513 [Liolophura sinensis]|uniref:uncharacterized protein LOC135463513 n=1 Tax=Liolophura sinensis TaxID=3198878 RepID=UPI0031591CFD